jgi:hypothetical protein
MSSKRESVSTLREVESLCGRMSFISTKQQHGRHRSDKRQTVKYVNEEIASETTSEHFLSRTCVKSGFLIGLEQVSLSSSSPAFCPNSPASRFAR